MIQFVSTPPVGCLRRGDTFVNRRPKCGAPKKTGGAHNIRREFAMSRKIVAVMAVLVAGSVLVTETNAGLRDRIKCRRACAQCCCEPTTACCEASPVCCEAAPTCCAPEPACCAPASVCCTPASTCCSPCSSGCPVSTASCCQPVTQASACCGETQVVATEPIAVESTAPISYDQECPSGCPPVASCPSSTRCCTPCTTSGRPRLLGRRRYR